MQRSEEIKETLELLERYWLEHPELRLGQIVSGASHAQTKNFDPCHMKDIQLRNFCRDNLPVEDNDH